MQIEGVETPHADTIFEFTNGHGFLSMQRSCAGVDEDDFQNNEFG